MKTWQKLKKDPKLFRRYFVKEYIISAARKFFEDRGYHELESPIFAFALPQERYLDPFRTSIQLPNSRKEEVYIIPTTETYNKKILAAGLGEHFVISKVARAMEDIGPNHSPEFTMLEWYHLNANYFDLMDDCEDLLRSMKQFVDKKLGREFSFEFLYQEHSIDISPGWDRVDLSLALEEHCDIKLSDIQDHKNFAEIMKSKGYNINFEEDWQTLFEWVFTSEIEGQFSSRRPTFVYNYPKQVCPLTKLNTENPLVCEKVELYIAGKEIANGYTELRDWKEQKRRFKEEQAARQKLGKRSIKFDYELIEALRSGIPPVAGIGMGLDRLAMIFANTKSISDVNYFPAQEWFE